MYSFLNPAFSLSDMFAIWAAMFRIAMFLFVEGPLLLLSGKVGFASSASLTSLICGMLSGTIDVSIPRYFYDKPNQNNTNLTQHLQSRSGFSCSDWIDIFCFTLVGIGVFFVSNVGFLLYLNYIKLFHDQQFVYSNVYLKTWRR